MRFQLEEAGRDAVNPDAGEQIDRSLHAEKSARIEHPRLVAAGAGLEDDLVAGDEIRRNHVPGPIKTRSQLLLPRFRHIDDTGRGGTEHPLV